MLWPRYRDGNRPVTRGNPLAASFGALIHKRGDIPAAWWSNGGEGEKERERGRRLWKTQRENRARETGRKRRKGVRRGGGERGKKERELSLSAQPHVCFSKGLHGDASL